MVNLMACITWIIVNESGEEMVREEFIELRRVLRKCCRTSGVEDPVMNAYDSSASRGCAWRSA